MTHQQLKHEAFLIIQMKWQMIIKYISLIFK